MSSYLSSVVEEGRRRATNEIVRDITKDIFHEFNKGDKHDEGEKYVNVVKEPIDVLQSACGGGDDEWQQSVDNNVHDFLNFVGTYRY